ncbi:hypothetical protein E4V51_33560 [Paenibacillus sp. 28ISP30-2]|nr:hypothetical protein [Paenibacillus sp. 28ISP30-2]
MFSSDPTPQPYSGYARWLDKQDKGAAKEYWRSILNGYDQPAVLPTLPVAHPLQAATGYLLYEIGRAWCRARGQA